MTLLDTGLVPRIPVGQWIDSGIDWITTNLDALLDVISDAGTSVTEGLAWLLLLPHPLIMVAIFGLLSWLVRSWKLAVGVAISFLLIISMNQWEQAMQTLALVLIATLTAVIIAVPLGIWAAKSDTVSAILRPVLDLMQTMPAFVYLIPAVTFFSIGVVPGLFSTIIFALPPGVRLTELGIRQVDSETVEAGQSFGATDWEILTGIQLPLAVRSIMAGVNQVIMLALSMAVIAGMVGADGLGKEVVSALATINIAKGAEAGLAIVFLAIFLDRFTSALGAPADHSSSLLATWKKKRTAKSIHAATAA
jgi:glycine betaine/proline transport system permease protein